MSTTSALTRLAIVVPTRNRADLVELTLQSIREEEPTVPVTVVVSDNSTSEEEALRTAQLVEDLQGRPSGLLDFAVIRPGEDLAMGKHWEWARRQAESMTGASHLMYLTDRTALKRGALTTLVELAAAHPAAVISYNNDQVNDDSDPVSLAAQRGSGAVHRVPTDRLLRLTSELVVSRPLPRALNTLVPVEVMSRLEATYGDVFDSVAPDFRFCFRALEETSHLLYVDLPLTVMHGLARSNGNSTTRGITSSDTADFLKRTQSRGIAPYAPLPRVATTYNVIASEYMREGGSKPPMDVGLYHRFLAAETDGFAAGPMRDANVEQLVEAGQRFDPMAVRRRKVQRALHFLRVLGPVDFLLLTWDRVRQPGARTFATKEEALDWARAHDAEGGTEMALRYLRGARVTRIARRTRG